MHEMRLSGGIENYDWGINGHRFDMTKPFEHTFDFRAGERVQLAFINATDMWHPGKTVTVQFDADNPGQWLTHCHYA